MQRYYVQESFSKDKLRDAYLKQSYNLGQYCIFSLNIRIKFVALEKIAVFKLIVTELILGCGSVIITLFFNIGPKFQVPCVAISALCRDLAHFRFCAYFWSFCLHFGPFNQFYSSNSVDFHRSRPLPRLDFYWLILNWAFLLSFLTKWLSRFCELRSRNLIITVCKHAHRNLKLQLYLA